LLGRSRQNGQPSAETQRPTGQRYPPDFRRSNVIGTQPPIGILSDQVSCRGIRRCRVHTHTHAASSTGRTCAHCGQRIPGGSGQGALLPDATVIDAYASDRDGHRYVSACTSDHLQVLIDLARHDWVVEQLWFGQLCRASTQPGATGVVVAQLAEHAGLSDDHLRRGLEWNAQRSKPMVTLPGGQIVPAHRPGPA
jgi:hypothetical protein